MPSLVSKQRDDLRDLGRRSDLSGPRRVRGCRRRSLQPSKNEVGNVCDQRDGVDGPVLIALRGIPSNSASSGSCAITRPPFSLIARSPMLPSDPVPDSTTQAESLPQNRRAKPRKNQRGVVRAPADCGGPSREIVEPRRHFATQAAGPARQTSRLAVAGEGATSPLPYAR